MADNVTVTINRSQNARAGREIVVHNAAATNQARTEFNRQLAGGGSPGTGYKPTYYEALKNGVGNPSR